MGGCPLPGGQRQPLIGCLSVEAAGSSSLDYLDCLGRLLNDLAILLCEADWAAVKDAEHRFRRA